MGGLRATPEQRLMARVRSEGECLVWTGWRAWFGHGLISIDGKNVRTHRLAYELAYGPIPEGMSVCHRCDNPPCVKPEHLFLGTQRDNNHDMRRKGRHFVPAVLTEEQAREILASTEPCAKLAARYGISQPAVNDLRSGRSWAHLGGERRTGGELRRLRAQNRRRQVVQLHRDGLSNRQIGERLGVQAATVTKDLSALRAEDAFRELEDEQR